MKAGIFIYDNVMISTALGVCDIFEAANMLMDRYELCSASSGHIETVLISWDGKAIATSNGKKIAAEQSLKDTPKLDVLIIPGMLNSATIRIHDKMLDRIKDFAKKGTLMCSICAGSYFLAEAGLLTHKKATTHWNLIEQFRQKFADVQWQINQLLVRDGDLITCGGVSSYQELSLYLIQQFYNAELSKYCSRFMLIEPGRNNQSPYIIDELPKSHEDNQILDLQNWLEQHYKEKIEITDMASLINTSEKTLLRKFKAATQTTPIKYLQDIRILKAKKILETSNDPLSNVTWAVGYEDVNSFKQLFRKKVGLSPREYREKFRSV